ncbi:hypothetical protein Purlil1_6227 [Purpureocillium lilacinum]|uniref:Uncharacterized protein n=1 Tax=Purpureocillium lilacinum TaxID=33203 RepID=A0ABR0C0G9_PURLI|nr:hypothetical protein Purlil1_6227 [Purpureocillium lilacinum]
MQEPEYEKRAQMEVRPQAAAVSPTKAAKPSSRLRDTGFPEPFNKDRNTTLPHPEADLSPNASISQGDVAVGDFAPHSRPFLSKRKRIISHGIVDRQGVAALGAPLAVLSPDADARSKEGLRLLKGSASSLQLPKNGVIAAESVGDEDEIPSRASSHTGTA